MTKYTVASARNVRREEPQLPAIWRGIGCLMILFVPLLAWALAALTIQIAVAQDWAIPYQLMGFPVMPPLIMRSGLAPVGVFLQSQENLYAVLLLTVIYVVALGALLSAGYAFIYRFVGPPRYTALDAPPPKIAVKRYKR